MKRVFRTALLFCLLLVLCVPAFAQKEDLQGIMYVRTVTPEAPTVTAVLCFPNVPFDCARHASVQWYRDGVPILYTPDFRVSKNACTVCRLSVCFSEHMPESEELKAVLTCNGTTYTYTTQLKIRNYGKDHYKRLKTLAYPYRIDIGRKQNVVIVYAQDENGEYTILQNAFLCSTGKPTPRGTFCTGDKMRWHLLYGSEETNYAYVYGQYCTRITQDILFHSVPYYTQDPADLEYDQFNMLGKRVSQGCVRLPVENAKWIYDNCPEGTQVNFVDYLDLPVSMPAAPKINTDDPRRGWDPTDPDEANPWRER